jgi:hypothetical protein
MGENLLNSTTSNELILQIDCNYLTCGNGSLGRIKSEMYSFFISATQCDSLIWLPISDLGGCFEREWIGSSSSMSVIGSDVTRIEFLLMLSAYDEFIR